MIVYALSIALAAAVPSAKADTDFILRWDIGEASRDASSYKIVWTLAGNLLTETSTYSGRNSGFPGFQPTAPKTTTLTEAQLKEVADLLAPLDAIKPKLAKPKFREGDYTTVQLTHGKHVLQLHLFEDVEGQAPKNATPAERDAYAKLGALRTKLVGISQ